MDGNGQSDPTYQQAYRKKVDQLKDQMMQIVIERLPRLFTEDITADELTADLTPDVLRDTVRETILFLSVDQILLRTVAAKNIRGSFYQELSTQQKRMFEAYNYGSGDKKEQDGGSTHGI